jgi:predicted NodU family carbamoyl transferase
MLHLAKWAREHTGEDKLALAGGVALNAKANMVIHYAKIFNDIFIFPAANDAGTPIGAAAWVYEHILGGKMRRGGLGLFIWALSTVMMRLGGLLRGVVGVLGMLVMMLIPLLT